MIRLLITMIIFFIVLSSCFTVKKKLPDNGTEYKIINITELKHNYIIYAKNRGTIRKIVSKKLESAICIKTLKVGRKYKLSLKSIFPNKIGKYRVASPQQDFYLGKILYNGDDIEVEDKKNMIRDVFVAHNLVGLCVDES